MTDTGRGLLFAVASIASSVSKRHAALVTTKSSTTGARRGLGLALVRQVVESRNGMISVGHDNGAVFTAVLPQCVAVAHEAREAPREKAPAKP